MTDAPSPAPQAGWYQDPHGPGQRYWDGAQWTDHVHAPAPPAFYGSPQGGVPGYGQPYAAPPAQAPGNVLSILAMVCGGIALLLCPILFGPAAIVLAAIAFSKKERLAGVGLAVGIGGMVLGFLIGAAVSTRL